MAADLTIYNDMLQEYYAGPTPQYLGYKDHPLLAMMPKKTNWGGQESKYIIPLHIETPQAVANDFATALANKGNGTYDRFEMGRKKKYGFAQLDRLALLASAQNPKAFMKLYTAEVDGTIAQMRRDIAWGLYRNSHAKRATVGSFSAGASSTITLSDRTEVVGFSVGMRIVFSDAGSAPGVAYTTGSAFVAYPITAINRSTGVLTVTGNVTSGSSLANGDHIHREGDIAAVGTFLGAEGLGDHIPQTAPSSGTFQGVDWTVDTDRLAGLRLDGSALTIEEALIEAGMRLKEAGKSPSHIFMNPTKFGQLVKELGSKVQHDKVKAPGAASLGFDAVKVYTPAGTLPVIPDADCPYNQIWVLSMKTWTLASVGQLPQLADDDVRMLRSSTADEYEVRLAAYYNLGCSDPGANLRIDL